MENGANRARLRVFLYLVFGLMTTVLNIAVYSCCADLFRMNTSFSTVLAWTVTVLVAYLTNRRLVFDSRATGIRQVGIELFEYFSCRVFTGVIDLAFMVLAVDWLSLPSLPMKLASNILVVVLNFILSVAVVFR